MSVQARSDDTTSNQSSVSAQELAAAALILKLYLEPSTWLVRRPDVTVIRDIRQVRWSTSLQVSVQLDQLAASGLDVSEEKKKLQIVLPVILKARQLLTGFSIRDHVGESVRTLTWEQTRPLIEQMLVGTARRIIAEQFGAATVLDPTLEKALRLFSGDIDEVDEARRLIDLWAAKENLCGLLEKQAEALLSDLAMRLLIQEYTSGFIVMAQTRLRPDWTCDLFIQHDDPIEDGTLRIPVGTSPDYQVEVMVPDGAIFRAEPRLERVDTGNQRHAIPFGRQRNVRIPQDGRKN